MIKHNKIKYISLAAALTSALKSPIKERLKDDFRKTHNLKDFS